MGDVLIILTYTDDSLFSKSLQWKQHGSSLKIVWKSNFYTNCNFHTVDIVRKQYGYTMDLVMQSKIPQYEFHYFFPVLHSTFSSRKLTKGDCGYHHMSDHGTQIRREGQFGIYPTHPVNISCRRKPEFSEKTYIRLLVKR